MAKDYTRVLRFALLARKTIGWFTDFGGSQTAANNNFKKNIGSKSDVLRGIEREVFGDSIGWHVVCIKGRPANNGVCD